MVLINSLHFEMSIFKQVICIWHICSWGLFWHLCTWRCTRIWRVVFLLALSVSVMAVSCGDLPFSVADVSFIVFIVAAKPPPCYCPLLWYCREIFSFISLCLCLLVTCAWQTVLCVFVRFIITRVFRIQFSKCFLVSELQEADRKSVLPCQWRERKRISRDVA